MPVKERERERVESIEQMDKVRFILLTVGERPILIVERELLVQIWYRIRPMNE